MNQNIWEIYEYYKRKIQAKNLPPEEYEKEIKALCDKLKI